MFENFTPQPYIRDHISNFTFLEPKFRLRYIVMGKTFKHWIFSENICMTHLSRPTPPNSTTLITNSLVPADSMIWIDRSPIFRYVFFLIKKKIKKKKVKKSFWWSKNQGKFFWEYLETIKKWFFFLKKLSYFKGNV